MTTLPPNYLRLSSKWLETNPLPEDGLLLEADDTWKPSSQRGRITATPGFDYATARTDLPKEAYLEESEPAPDLTQPGLPKAGLTQPEAASERAEVPVPCSTNSVWPMTDKVFIEYARWRLSRPNHGDAHELIDHALKRPKTMREHAMELESTIATLRAQLDAKEAECRELRESNAVLQSQVDNADVNLEQVRLIEKGKNDKLRAEVEELKGWKASAIAVWPPIQEIGNALGLRLGVSVHDKILPGILRLTAELDAVRKKLRNRDESIAAKRKYIEKCNHLPELVIDSESGPICCECWAIEEKSRADKWQTILEANNDLMPTGVNFYFCVEEFFRQVRGMWNEQMDVLRNCGTAIVKAESERDAAQARCGALERAVAQARNWEFLDNHKEGCQMFGLHPKPCSCGKEQRIAYLDQFLTPSQQPDNLKGGDEPCSHESETGVAPAVLLSKSTADATKDTSVASNPQPESPIPSGVGQPDNLDSSSTEGRAAEGQTRPDTNLLQPSPRETQVSENQASPAVTPSRPEPVKAGEWLPMETAPKRKVLLRIQTSPDAFRTVEALWINGQWDFDGMLFFKPVGWKPIAPEGKATEGEG